MASVKLADNAYGTLGGALASTASSITFTSGHGARFPAVAAGECLYVCLLNSNNVLEEIQITTHTASADTADVVRAAGGTTAKAWNAGDRIEARISSTAIAGPLPVNGSTTNDNAAAGKIGEFIASTVAQSGAVALGTSTTATNVASIVLTPGDWDVSGRVNLTGAQTCNVLFFSGSVSSTSSAEPPPHDITNISFANTGLPVFQKADLSAPIPSTRYSLAATSTAFLIARASFSTSTCGAYGRISARRAR